MHLLAAYAVTDGVPRLEVRTNSAHTADLREGAFVVGRLVLEVIVDGGVPSDHLVSDEQFL